MTQDTRKDKRAKIVSLNVRYKSATVDEFIDNHSHDVSKGGIFIKTPTPFSPGTLIKFEIRIQGDKAVIAGVGRVVWKRDAAASAGGDRPSGMGVKFIKIDDSSRTVIDRIVLERADAGAAYQTESDATDGPALRPPTSDKPPMDPRPSPSAAPAIGASSKPKLQIDRKSTMTGLGAVSSHPSQPAAPPAPDGMFPTGDSKADMPPKGEQTVMKQAAELLEEALKEAGGSMDEIGSNPLFTEGNKVQQKQIDPKSTLLGMPAPAVLPASRPDELKREAASAAAVAKRVPSDAPPTARESPSAKISTSPKADSKTPPPANRKISERPASAVEAMIPAKRSGPSPLLWVALIVVIGGGIAYVYKGNLGGEAPPPPADVAPVVTPPPAPAPAPTPTVTASASAAPPASASAAPSATTSAAASASAAPSATAAPKPTATAAPTPTATAAPKPTATAAPKPTPAPKPTATAAPTATETPAPAPKPKPKPAPKPAGDDSDNPY